DQPARLGVAGRRPADGVAVRGPDGDLSGRVAADSRRTVRSVRIGRCEPVAAVRVDHDPDALAGAVLQPRPADDPGVSGVHPGLRGQRRARRPGGLDAVLHAVPLRSRFRRLAHGLRLGDGLGPADRHRYRDGSAVPQLPGLGLLPGQEGLMVAATTAASARTVNWRRIGLHAGCLVVLLVLLYPL